MTKTITVLLIVFFSSDVFSQHAVEYTYQKISSERISELKKELKYDRTKKQLVLKKFDSQPKEKINDPIRSGGAEHIFSAVMYIAAALFIIAILYFIYNDIQKNKTKALTNKALELNQLMIEDIAAVDFDPLLEEALRQGNFRVAIRIKFLRILQQLQLKKYIQWKPNKTNRKYALEISKTELRHSFKNIAQIFDRLWYGNLAINKAEYEYCNSLFDQFSNNIEK